jgi:hypothetical protein
MKTVMAAISLMWLALIVELAMPSMLVQGSLLLPIACGVMFWTRSTSGLIVSGLILLLDSIARPTQLPLCPMCLPFIAVTCLAPPVHSEEYRARGFSFRIPVPLQLPLLTLAAVLLQCVGSIPLDQFPTFSADVSTIPDRVKSLAIIGLPLSGGLSLMMRLADELGLRRSFG